MWSSSMTLEEMQRAAESQRKLDLYNAKMWRDHYQAQVDKLEAADPLRKVSTGN